MSQRLEHLRAFSILALSIFLFSSPPASAQKAGALKHKKEGDAQAAKGNLAKAEASYKRAVAADRSYRGGYTALSTHYLRQQKYGAAIALLKRVVKRDKRYSEGWYNLAYALRKSGMMAEAIKAYRSFVRMDPKSADPYFGLGLALKSLSKYKEAAASFRRYAALEKRSDRRSWIAKADKMAVAMEEKAAGGATAASVPPAPAAKPAPTPAAKSSASPGEKARVRGDQLYREGRVTEAVAKYKEAIKADPRDAAAHDALATCLFRLRRYSAAVKVFRSATKANPSYTQSWYNLAYAQRKLGRHARAVKAYERYIKLNPDNSDPYFGLALAYKGMGKKKKAVEAFQLYIQKERRPGQEKWIHKARVEIARIQGKPAPAAGEAATPTLPSLPPTAGAEKTTAGTARPKAAATASGEEDEVARKQRERDMAMMLATTRYTEKSSKKGRKGRRGRRRKAKRGGHLPLVTAAEDRPIAPPVPDEPQAGGGDSESSKLRIQSDTLARMGKCRTALPLYRKGAKLDPFNTRIFDGLAFCSYQLGQHAKGIAALRIAMRDNPQYRRAWLHKARLERASRKDVAAVGSFRRYLSGKKPNPEAHFELARTLRALKMNDQAITAYATYLKMENRAFATSQVLAAHLEMKKLGGTPPATKITMPGDGGRTLTVAAYIKRRKAQVEDEEKVAASLPTPVFNKEPKPAPAPKVKAKAKVVEPELPKLPPSAGLPPAPPPMPSAETKAAPIKGTDAGTMELARAVSGDVTDGTLPFPAAAAPPAMYKSAKDTSRGLIKLADREFSRRHLVLALGLYGQAAALDPSNAEALYKGGVTAMTLGQMDRAAAFYRKLLRLNAKDEAARFNLDLARKAGRNQALEARRVKARARRVEAMLAARQYDNAEEKASGLLRHSPSAGLYLLRARARLSKGDAKGALNDGGRALSLDPNLPGAIRVMGDAHLKQGIKSKALFYYRLFLARTPIKARHDRDRKEVQKIIQRL